MADERTGGGSPRLVLFDLDRTVVRGSSERAFALYLVAEGILEPRDLGRWLGTALAEWRVGHRLDLRGNRSYLAAQRLPGDWPIGALRLGTDLLVYATVLFCVVRALPVPWDGRRLFFAGRPDAPG